MIKIQIIEYNSKYYPKELLKISNPPKRLYAKGNIDLLNSNSIAIIGSRACSMYGIEQAKLFSSSLTFQGITIVSGLAIGIDTVAHTSCLECNGKTIAVLGCGFNHIFPKENIKLYEEIIEKQGLVISEYPPNEPPSSKHFLERNRIVSGLSIGILIVEAAYRSGTSVTAKLALSQNKKIFCIPHNLGDKHGVGTNKLIKNGANLVTCAKDIIDSFDFLTYKNSMHEEKVLSNSNIPSKYLDVYNLLIGPPLNSNQICMKLNKTPQYVNNALFILELDGNIIKTPNGYQANV